MKYVTVLTIIHHFAGVGLVLWILRCSTRLLFHRSLFKNITKFSPLISIYFVFLFLYSTTSLVNFAYMLAFWRPETNEYNGLVMFWLGVTPFLLGYLGTILEIFLCLDRCFSIIFPFKYSAHHRLYLTHLALILVVFVAWFELFTAGILGTLQRIQPQTSCTIFGCLLASLPTTYLSDSKIVIIFTNLAGGLTLYGLRRFMLRSNNIQNKRISKSVVIIIISTAFFETVPTWISVLTRRVS